MKKWVTVRMEENGPVMVELWDDRDKNEPHTVFTCRDDGIWWCEGESCTRSQLDDTIEVDASVIDDLESITTGVIGWV